jgi:hypothetical protein
MVELILAFAIVSLVVVVIRLQKKNEALEAELTRLQKKQ